MYDNIWSSLLYSPVTVEIDTRHTARIFMHGKCDGLKAVSNAVRFRASDLPFSIPKMKASAYAARIFQI